MDEIAAGLSPGVTELMVCLVISTISCTCTDKGTSLLIFRAAISILAEEQREKKIPLNDVPMVPDITARQTQCSTKLIVFQVFK